MALLQTWRWYGPNDIVSLDDIEQTGATGVVHALHHVPVGEVWEVSEIQKRKKEIEWNHEEDCPRNLTWAVVESLNVHEGIKQGLPERDVLIDKYIQSLKNLSECGIKVVCYNFMPVLDWTRTDLRYKMRDGSLALRFQYEALIAFDLFMLKRERAELEYTELQLNRAQEYFKGLSEEERNKLSDAVLQGVPGSGEMLGIEEFRSLLSKYSLIDKEKLQENLSYFLQKVVPVAEEYRIKMCCHPDDPPFQLFGVPRTVSSEEDLSFLVNTIDSESNGITFCTGSLAPNPDADLAGIVDRLGSKIHFIHLRNIVREGGGSFYEGDHLEGSVDMHEVMLALVKESDRRKLAGRSDYQIPYRPDHGHQMLDDLDKTIPFHGYSAIGRMRGLAELRGLEMGIRDTLNKK
ncbi:MAG: mannonate dehydratase [Balneolaceae bacterium]